MTFRRETFQRILIGSPKGTHCRHSTTPSLGHNESFLEPEDPDTGKILNGLASCCFEQKNYGKAELLYRRAPAVKESSAQPGHDPIVDYFLGAWLPSAPPKPIEHQETKPKVV